MRGEGIDRVALGVSVRVRFGDHSHDPRDVDVATGEAVLGAVAPMADRDVDLAVSQFLEQGRAPFTATVVAHLAQVDPDAGKLGVKPTKHAAEHPLDVHRIAHNRQGSAVAELDVLGEVDETRGRLENAERVVKTPRPDEVSREPRRSR